MNLSPKPYSFQFLTYLGFLLLLTIGGCRQDSEQSEDNPPMPGFNQAGSDPKAIQIADKVMKAQGGRKNWDETHYLTWNFFGVRKLLWDKHSGNVRVDYLKDGTRVLVNVNDGKGRVFQNGAEITQPDSLVKYLQEGKAAWINDSYWLFMPFKLKDSGVTLKYLGEDTTAAGKPADVLKLTFQEVGVTPENGYKVYVDKESRLVSQWAYFKNAGSDQPDFVLPWNDYQTHGKIKLSGDRGERKITEIKVMDQVPESAFQSLEPINL
jgi:hypothetical protein